LARVGLLGCPERFRSLSPALPNYTSIVLMKMQFLLVCGDFPGAGVVLSAMASSGKKYALVK